MKVRHCTLLMVLFSTMGLYAQQPSKLSFEQVRNVPTMNWQCPKIEQNELKAREISSVFEYILRHQNKHMNANTRKIIRRTTR